MDYLFTVKNDHIKPNSELELYSGNINTYTFSFEMDEEWNEFTKIAIFIKSEKAYNVEICNNQLTVPHEILASAGSVKFGIYAVYGTDNIKRLSTNLITFDVQRGAYTDAISPTVYEPDLWEQLLSNYLPKIIDGNWHIYDLEKKNYIDTGIKAQALSPQKGIDYFTPEDIASLGIDSKENISNKSLAIGSVPSEEKYTSEIAVANFVNSSIQSAIIDSWEAEV